IPWEATIIVNFQTVRDLGWLNTFQGLTVPSFAMGFGIFLLRQSFRTLPNDLHEAMQVDGASRFRFFVSTVLPLNRPMLATLAVFTFITTWNTYLWPLLVTSEERVRTVQIALRSLQGEATTAWPLVMAATVLVMAGPLSVLVLGPRQLKAGLVAGAVKGRRRCRPSRGLGVGRGPGGRGPSRWRATGAAAAGAGAGPAHRGVPAAAEGEALGSRAGAERREPSGMSEPSAPGSLCNVSSGW